MNVLVEHSLLADGAEVPATQCLQVQAQTQCQAEGDVETWSSASGSAMNGADKRDVLQDLSTQTELVTGRDRSPRFRNKAKPETAD